MTVTLCAATYTVETVPNVHIQNRTRYLSNPDGVISQTMQAQIDSVLSQIWKETSVEAVAVVVDDIDPQDYDTFATDLFMHWGIGKKDNDNGVLVLVVKDMRKAVIRTGYGTEGALPDIISSRILREEMFPRFKEGDYDGGLYHAVLRIEKILSDPSLKEELLSKYENDADSDPMTVTEMVYTFLVWGLFLLVVMLCVVTYKYYGKKKLTRKRRYGELSTLKMVTLATSFVGFGIPLPAYFLNKYFMKRIRNEAPICDHCHTEMILLPKTDGLMKLNPVQTTESHIGAAEFDAWQCPKCHEVKILEYAGSRKYARCPYCGARAEAFLGDKVITAPTYYSTGQGVHQYICRHCGKATAMAFVLPMLVRAVSGGGSGFGGGSGISGGSFGGGMTGGGGASGGW